MDEKTERNNYWEAVRLLNEIIDEGADDRESLLAELDNDLND